MMRVESGTTEGSVLLARADSRHGGLRRKKNAPEYMLSALLRCCNARLIDAIDPLRGSPLGRAEVERRRPSVVTSARTYALK